MYVLAQISIQDRERYNRYASQFMDVLAPYGGVLLAADEDPVVLEGRWPRDKVVLISFADRQRFESWATSAEYQRISVDRVAATDGTVLLVHGL